VRVEEPGNAKIRTVHAARTHARAGFTLLEVMISLAIVGGLLITLLYTLNYNLGIAERHRVITISTHLAKEKMYEMERKPAAGKGQFPEPYASFSYETNVKDSLFPGMSEITVVVKNAQEEFSLSELVKKAK
jgi:prepilin-type N-terminal cleavage/methylation domain-containing protein